MLFFDKTKCRLLTLCSTAVLLAACGGGGSSSDSDSDSTSSGSQVESTNDNTTDDSTVVDTTDDSTTDDSTSDDSDDTVAAVAAITTSTTVSLKATDTLVLPEKLEVVNAEEDAETIASKMSFKASYKASFEETGTDYTNAPQHTFTWTEALQPIQKVNSILCFTSQFKAIEFVNEGPYLVWVDEDNCFDNSGEGESTSSQTSQSQGGQSTSEDNRTTYTEVVVNVTREEGSALIVDAWIPDSEGGGDDEDSEDGEDFAQAIKFRATVVEGATDDDPFGQFRFSYNFYPTIDSTDSFGGGEVRTVAALDGFIGFTLFEESEMSFGEFSMTSSESASVVMSDDMSDGVALTSTYRDEGGWSEGAAYALSFNEDYVLIQDGDDYDSLAFRAQDNGGSSGTCLSRTNFNEQVWRYSLFHADTGAQLVLNSGFPFRYDSNGDGENNGHGFLDYWGMWTEDNTGVDDGATVYQESWDTEEEPTAFTVLKAPGRLIKNSVEALALDQLKGVELMYWDNSAFSAGYDEWVVKYQSVTDDGVAVNGLYVVAGLSWPQHDDMGGGGRGGEEPAGEDIGIFECPEGEDCSHMTMIECAEGEDCADMFMCPEGEDCSNMTEFECPPGEDCGDMFMCPPGEDCSDLGMFECPPGEVCDMDIVFCPEGEDCSSMTKLECPEGETCPDMFMCPEGEDCSDMTAFECPPGADCADMFKCPEGEDCSDMDIFHECPEGEVCEEPPTGNAPSIKQAIAAATDPATTTSDSSSSDGTVDDGKMEGDGGEGFQDFGPTKTAITPVLLTVDNGGYEGNDVVHMYSQQLGGGVQYKIGADAIRFFRETNITGSEEDVFDAEGNLNLLCYMECPKGTLGADQLADWEGDSSPYEAFPESLDDAISFSVSSSGSNRMTLVRTSNSEPVKYASDVSQESLESAGSPFSWGVRTGPMVTAAIAADLQNPWDVHNPDLVSEFYIWETGLDEWHQMVTVIDANGDVVALDKPMEFNYQHSDANDRTADAGDYDGQTFLIGYMGNGNMWGIPHGQIGEGRWAPIFSIADGTVMGPNDQYVIKALDVERKMAQAENGCTDLVVNNPAAPIPTGRVDVVEIGEMPVVEDSPSVIGGEVQGSSTADAE